ncbi:hypothetical protein YB2330_000243 [Saitoella coloradoensis]
MAKTQIDILTEWMRQHKIYVHPNLVVKPHDEYPGFGVYASENEDRQIDEHTTILKVPKSAILCPVTSGIANLLEEAEIDGMLGVAVAYLYEKSLGEKSPWWGYLQILPESEDSPKLWPEDQKQWLKGTEVEEVGGLDNSDVKEHYNDVLLPFFKENQEVFPAASLETDFSYNAFGKAMSVVASRAFEIDQYRQLALVPFADIFNHGAEEHVHFETNDDVCTVCGEFGYCEHMAAEDQEEEEEGAEEESRKRRMSDASSCPSLSGAPEEQPLRQEPDEADDEDLYKDDFDANDDTCDMTIVRKTSPGEEIFNTYGPLGNDVLLARYGFAIKDNEADSVSVAREMLATEGSRKKWWLANAHAVCKTLGLLEDDEEGHGGCGSDCGCGDEHDDCGSDCDDEHDHDHDHEHGHGHGSHDHDDEEDEESADEEIGGKEDGEGWEDEDDEEDEDEEEEEDEEEIDPEEFAQDCLTIDYPSTPSSPLLVLLLIYSIPASFFELGQSDPQGALVQLGELLEIISEIGAGELAVLEVASEKPKLKIITEAFENLETAVRKRYERYTDAKITSAEYEVIINELPKEETRKRNALTVVANEKKILEGTLESVDRVLALLRKAIEKKTQKKPAGKNVKKGRK